jgi:pyruvate dehydrogenase (quinone)
MEDCDTLLLVGTSFPYIEFLPKPGQARGVQIDLDPVRIGLRYPVEVGLVGDTRSTLAELIPLLAGAGGRPEGGGAAGGYDEARGGKARGEGLLGKAREQMKSWREELATQAGRMDKPMKPQVVAWELGRRLADDAIVSSDSGTNTTWFARHIPVKRGQMHSVSGTLASMACGLPYAIAAQLAYPERQCVAFVGDGGFTMLMGELATAVKYQLPIKIVVVKNNTLGQIKWEQMVFLGNPEFGCDLHPIDFAAFARACGARGFTIDDPAQCGAVLDEALATPGPVLIEAVVDPFEPPMPGKVDLKQAAKLGEALLRGEPNRGKIALTILSDKVRELV